ncbi:hypothetical protein [Pseudomonas lurida]|uniref:hypothetical protein n=1 Tax=Pseudomonas lurida TaxID=244566 RepID=UPI00178239C2|nr:hypothetical protein [Pseudomonas lurida]MBD8671658.1 hypothetical protein [Pseudomonas lurida]
MNIEVFEGATTVDEAVAAAQGARRQRLILYVDLKGEGVRLNLLTHLADKERKMFSNQLSVAINDRSGIPERLARRLEQVINLPFGWFDQPFPERELRASIARGVRLRRKLKMYDLDHKFLRSSKLKMQQIQGAPSGERGVSKALYLQVVAALIPKKIKPNKDVGG